MTNIFTALDVGTSQIKGLVAQKEEKKFRILARKTKPSLGVRRGMVIDPESVGKIILELKKELENDSGIQIKEVAVNIGGHHIFSKEVHGAIAISRADQKVSQEDIDRVLDEASKIKLPLNKEVLEIIPRSFVLDGEKDIRDPLNLKGIKLEVEGIAICAFSSYLQNLESALEIANLVPVVMVPSPLASSEAILSDRQKELGVILVEIGEGTTQMAVFEEGNLLNLTIFPIGSLNITNDIAVALQTEIEVAKLIKEKFGGLAFKNTRRIEKIKLPNGEEFRFSTQKLSRAIRARVDEILDLVKKELQKIAKANTLPGGIVFVGGGAKFQGLVEYTKKRIPLPVKTAKPFGFLEDLGPEWATVCGLIKILEKEKSETPEMSTKLWGKIKKLWGKIKNFILLLRP